MELRMSRKERDRLKVVAALAERRLRQRAAAGLVGLSERQVRRILVRYRAEGDAGLVHRARGRPSNRRVPETLRRRVMGRVVRQYRDFGPTLATEKLAERDGLRVSRETLRGWMMAEGLWKPRRPRREVHLWRPRRPSFGELVQMDTSEHAWFEGRGDAEPVLVKMIDDATSRTLLRFFPADTTEANLQMLGLWLRRHGRPGAIYADRDSIFKVNRPPTGEETRAGRQAETQFGRALRELGSDYIPAASPEAKGRVERSFQTDQDRLVKELRLRGISDIPSANAYLEAEYEPMLNARFTVPPASSVDAHRPAKGYDLAAILSIQTVRTVANDYTVRHGGRRYQIERRSIAGGLRGSKVIVEERLDGSMRLRFRGRYLRWHEVASAAPNPPTRQRRRGAGASTPPPVAPAPAPRRPAADHPWRQPFQKKRTFLLCGKEDISTLR
ncbi:MAG TPA: ISNCY family transposase [Phycisphaerae bacterium]|nr:ISNCY family transposase [Phycisphaerae bacterium]